MTPFDVTPVTYLDHTDVPTEVLDVMTPRYPGGDVTPWIPSVTNHVDARQIHLTVHQHITVQSAAAPSGTEPAPQLDASADPTPVALTPTTRGGLDLGDITAWGALAVVVILLVGVLVFLDLLVSVMGTALAVIAGISLIMILGSMGRGKCSGVFVHCFGCKS